MRSEGAVSGEGSGCGGEDGDGRGWSHARTRRLPPHPLSRAAEVNAVYTSTLSQPRPQEPPKSVPLLPPAAHLLAEAGGSGMIGVTFTILSWTHALNGCCVWCHILLGLLCFSGVCL